MKPVCVKCQRFYKPKKNGTAFLEMKPIGGKTVPAGTEAPELWEPYKVWMGDLWACPGCGNELLSGVGLAPLSQDFRPDFERIIESYHADRIKINDC